MDILTVPICGTVKNARKKLKLRKRDVEHGIYLGTKCPQVEMLSNGKKRETSAGNVRDIFRLIQFTPSPKAEPFKQAKVGYELVAVFL